MNAQIFAGFGRRRLIPEEPVPLGGYGNEASRFHNSLGEAVCVSCIAITDETGNTVLMLCIDTITCAKKLSATVRAYVSAATGVSEQQITVSATHTHAGPSFRIDEFPSVPRFLEQVCRKAVDAAREAMADRRPAAMRTGSVETRDLNFVKHYKVQDHDTGAVSYAGDIFGTFKNQTILQHVTEADPTMHLLQFIREGAKDIVLCNFRAHPHFHGGYKAYMLSADYIGVYRRVFEQLSDSYTVYFQGACGNINATSRIQEEKRYTTCESYGTALAAVALECLGKHMGDVEAGPVRSISRVYRGTLWNETADKVAHAKEIVDLWNEKFDNKACKAAGKPYGIRSSFHARSIVARAERKIEDGDIMMNAVSIGDSFAFVTYPGEMFDALSAYMEEHSPFSMTMMLGYTQDHLGYLPSRITYDYTSYETDATRFAPGTGEQVVDYQVQMLNELKNAQ